MEATGKGEVVFEGQVNDPVGVAGRFREHVLIVERAELDADARSAQRVGGLRRAGEPHHFVAGAE